MSLFRIVSVRSRSQDFVRTGALLLDEQFEPVPQHPTHAISFPLWLVPHEVREGQIWRVAGKKSKTSFEQNGFRITEYRVKATRAELARPSGEHIVQLLHKSDDFPGVGEVTARKLWQAHGEDLYKLLDASDRQAIAGVIGDKLADVVLDGWGAFGASDSLQWLHRTGFDVRIAKSALNVYGQDARAALEEDPYRALALGMSWGGADQLAQAHFKIAADDPRRLAAAVEAVLYEATEDGHTAARPESLLSSLRSLVGSMAEQALELALQIGTVHNYEGLVATLGMCAVEQTIAEQLVHRSQLPPLCDLATAERLIKAYEVKTAHEIEREFGLGDAQREAVAGVTQHGVQLVVGGAGVGKTTTLRAVVDVLEAIEFPFQTVTVTGRAAKRAAEATGRPASTVAGYLNSLNKEQSEDPFVLIVDEASMLDVLLAYRLFTKLPEGSRIVLLGDPGQLHPVGPGLTLHALVQTDLPKVELTQDRRFAGLIATASKEIRAGRWPELQSDENAAMAAVSVPRQQLVQEAVRLYLLDPAETQVLSFNRTGKVSSHSISLAIQQTLVGAPQSLSRDEVRVPLKVENEDGQLEYTGLRAKDKVLCGRNLWDEGLQNGSLGEIVCLHEPPVMRSKLQKLSPKQADELVFAQVLWDDGVQRPVTLTVLDSLELAYAITTHKSQGSQFSRVIVVATPGHLLDRTIVYTAVTRATTQVLIVGDIPAVQQAVKDPPAASALVTTLEARVRALLEISRQPPPLDAGVDS